MTALARNHAFDHFVADADLGGERADRPFLNVEQPEDQRDGLFRNHLQLLVYQLKTHRTLDRTVNLVY